jgi:hypothetical protein
MGTVRTFALMAIVYAVTATAKDNILSRTRGELSFNHAMGAMGIFGYALVDGASQIRGILTHCNGQREGYGWYSNPDFVYHSIKAVSGTALFYILFGAAENVTAALVHRFPSLLHVSSLLPAQD